MVFTDEGFAGWYSAWLRQLRRHTRYGLRRRILISFVLF
jgi:hypothetical protein